MLRGPPHLRQPAFRATRIVCSKGTNGTPTSTPARESVAYQPLLLVAGVVLIDEQKRVLLAQRPKGKTHEGLWEFPGGKMEVGESPDDAAVREIEEEIGVEIDRSSLVPVTFVSRKNCVTGGRRHLLLLLYECRRWTGVARGVEGQEVVWVDANTLPSYKLTPADTPSLPLVLDALARDV